MYPYFLYVLRKMTFFTWRFLAGHTFKSWYFAFTCNSRMLSIFITERVLIVIEVLIGDVEVFLSRIYEVAHTHGYVLAPLKPRSRV